MYDGFGEELDSFLDAVADRYEVRQTLKDTPGETTEMVWRKCGPDGPMVGPFVRKTFKSGGGRGSAYEEMLKAQVEGHHLAHQPYLYECEHIDETLQVIMQYVSGQDLREYVASRGGGLELTRWVIPELSDALTELHESFEHPIIHRDIKPSNVMISSEGITLIDLGIARAYRTGAAHDTERLGTPGYAPPEQFGYGQTDVRSDIYALGMTCAFCLTGKDPTTQLVERGFVDDMIPEAIQPLLAKACAFDPQARYATVRAFKEALIEATDELGGVDSESRKTSSVGVPGQGSGEAEQRAAADKDGAAASEVTGEVAKPATVKTISLRSKVLGTIWDVVVMDVLIFFYMGTFNAISNPYGDLARQPTWFTAVQYITIIAIPLTIVCYVLLYKQHFKQWLGPLGRLSKKQEIFYSVVACLIFALLGIVLTLVFRW